MGQALARCLGYDKIIEEREDKLQDKQNRRAVEELERRKHRYERMLVHARAINDILESKTKEAANEDKRLQLAIQKLRTSVKAGEEPSPAQHAQMTQLLLDRQYNKKCITRDTTRLMQMRVYTRETQELQAGLELHTHEAMLIREGKRAVSDKEEDAADEHVEEKDDFAARLQNMMRTYESSQSMPLATVSEEDCQQLREEAAAMFLAAAEFKIPVTKPGTLSVAAPPQTSVGVAVAAPTTTTTSQKHEPGAALARIFNVVVPPIPAIAERPRISQDELA